jgi:hypothetical protein
MGLQDPPLCSRDVVCRYQKELWDLIEHPEASTAAHIVSYISMMFVVVSTIGMSLNTMPGLKVFNICACSMQYVVFCCLLIDCLIGFY